MFCHFKHVTYSDPLILWNAPVNVQLHVPGDLTPMYNCMYQVTLMHSCMYQVTLIDNCLYQMAPVYNCMYQVTPMYNCMYQVTPMYNCMYQVTPMYNCMYQVTPPREFSWGMLQQQEAPPLCTHLIVFFRHWHSELHTLLVDLGAANGVSVCLWVFWRVS